MLDWDSLIDFPPEKVKIMTDIIDEKRSSEPLSGPFVNQILREDIFNILDIY